ncbi:hypothetical protein PMSD_25915 [Paenibacillus macquariensis subsp. defensor]|nr:hypothetical protein PMSD_25915 [Paenibacillus macquariensis subsp. defensor]
MDCVGRNVMVLGVTRGPRNSERLISTPILCPFNPDILTPNNTKFVWLKFLTKQNVVGKGETYKWRKS